MLVLLEAPSIQKSGAIRRPLTMPRSIYSNKNILTKLSNIKHTTIVGLFRKNRTFWQTLDQTINIISLLYDSTQHKLLKSNFLANCAPIPLPRFRRVVQISLPTLQKKGQHSKRTFRHPPP